MSYALFVDEKYEAWLDEFDTLEEARAAYEQINTDQWRPRVALVQIIEEKNQDEN